VILRHLTAADARRVPWKNGRGVTEELALWPPGASFELGDYDWRLARAGVSEPGPFSEFPGFDRVLLVTRGAGLLLRHGADASPTRAAPLQPVRFSGDGPTSAQLPGGPVTDLNLLLRRGAARGDVQVLQPGAGPLPARLAAAHVLLVLLDGAAQVRGLGVPVALAAGELLWLREAAAEAEISGAATLALVRIDGP
jgi:uncharacterized protein